MRVCISVPWSFRNIYKDFQCFVMAAYCNQRWRPTQWSKLLDIANFEISASKYRVSSKCQCSSSFTSQDSDFLHLPSAAILEFIMPARRLVRHFSLSYLEESMTKCGCSRKISATDRSELNDKISKVKLWTSC